MKKITTFLILGICFIGLNSSSCHDDDNVPSHLKIINRSNSDIYVGVSSSYPDTALSHIEVIPFYKGNKTQKIEAGDTMSVRTIILAEDNITQMFFFDANVIEREPWDSIVSHYIVLERKEITESDLKMSNWIIAYP
ncbi:hypothetical protein [Mangrovibacterium sp.]|uniref:hypothetical protein n=1 Tax=Mangrovibacterium sp. TaxID=1961364 RepID=UPI003562CD93